jgi:hypothetical protein
VCPLRKQRRLPALAKSGRKPAKARFLRFTCLFRGDVPKDPKKIKFESPATGS